MFSVGEIMERNVLTIPRGTPLKVAARTLADRDVGGAPVCDAAGHVLGILSKTDLVEAFTSGEDQLVEDVMYPEVLSVDAGAPIQAAIHRMAFEGVHRLLVFGEDGKLAGIVTSMDVLRALAGLPRRSDRIIAVAP